MATNTINNDGSYVKSELHAHIFTIVFHHPQGNALTASLLADLTREVSHASHNADVQVIMLRSVGTAFCGGASFTELLQIQTEKEGIRFFSGVANLILTMRRCPKFILACVHGKCVGGGVGIAAAADYAIALEGADIKLSELTIGIGPFVVGPAIERKTGVSAFSQLAIDAGNWRNADWARRKGIYAELHPTVESMEESIARITSSLAHYSAEAMSEIKKMIWHNTEHWEQLLHERAAISGKLVTSAASKKFFDKFRENKTIPM
jgi:methylglutaconyl-CoA hydratase